MEKYVDITIYIDESGSTKEKEFIIGGYYTLDKSMEEWKSQCYSKLAKLTKSHGIDIKKDDLPLIRHRVALKQEFYPAEKITIDLFEDEDLHFIYIQDSKNNFYDSTIYYIDMLRQLLEETIYHIHKQYPKTELQIKIICARRSDGDHITKEEYQQIIIPSIQINELFVKIDKDIQLESGTQYSPLVFADHFCNALYSTLKNEDPRNPDKKVIEYLQSAHKIIVKTIYKMDKNSIKRAFDSQDYGKLLYTYVKSEEMQFLEEIEAGILTLKEDQKKIDKFILDYKAFLKILENQSVVEYTYQEKLIEYQKLYKLIETLEIDDTIACLFILNIDILACCNHMGNTSGAKKCITWNNSHLEECFDRKQFKDYVPIYLNVQSVYYQNSYNSKLMIDSASTCLNYYNKSQNSQELRDLLSIKTSDEEIKDNELGKIHGTLGQAYMYNYMLYEKEESLKEAELNFKQALEHLGKQEKNRQYNYLMHLYRINGNEQKFLETLNQAYDETIGMPKEENLIKRIELLIKGDVDRFLKAEIYAYALLFTSDTCTKVQECIIANLDIINDIAQNPSLPEILIIRDYARLCYLLQKEVDLSNFDIVYSWCKKVGATSSLVRLIELSCLLVAYECENQTNGKQIKNILKVICENQQNSYREVFGAFANSDIDEQWITNIRAKLYF